MPSVLQVELVAYYVCSHSSLTLSGSPKSNPCRTSYTVVAELCPILRILNPANQVTNSGQSKQKEKYKFISSRGMSIDKMQVNNLETAITKDYLGLSTDCLIFNSAITAKH